MLEIKNISKNFGSKKVINNLSIQVSKGVIYGLIGPNGAGKTTTLRILLNILQPEAGEILFNNKKIDSGFLNHTGYLPEERGLYPKSKVKNTLIYLAQLKGLSKNESEKRLNYWFERLELDQYSNYLIDELSKGNQQKVQFVSAILHDPEIIILDEPFSGFDPVNQSIFREIIVELKNEKYIILSTHIMDLAESLCDDICLINKGEKVIEGSLLNILKSTEKNIYTFTFRDFSEKEKNKIVEKFNIIEQNGNEIKIDIKDIKPLNFIKSLNLESEIFEVKKENPSLNNIFLKLVNH